MPVFFPLYGEVRSSLLPFNPATISRPLRTSTYRLFRMSIPRHWMPAFISSIVPDVIRLRAVYLRCPLSFFLSSFFLPAVPPFPKYAYSGIKWPIFLKIPLFLLFYLHIPFICCTFAPFYHIGTTVKRRSNDGQATVKANVTYLLHQKRAQIYV